MLHWYDGDCQYNHELEMSQDPADEEPHTGLCSVGVTFQPGLSFEGVGVPKPSPHNVQEVGGMMEQCATKCVPEHATWNRELSFSRLGSGVESYL